MFMLLAIASVINLTKCSLGYSDEHYRKVYQETTLTYSSCLGNNPSTEIICQCRMMFDLPDTTLCNSKTF